MTNNIDINSICQQFAQILNGKIVSSDNKSCKIIRTRNLSVKIMGRYSDKSISEIYFESMDEDGIALNLGEAALLQEEVDPFVFSLLNDGIIVSAVHNHWFFSDPLIMYIHFQSIDNPLAFAIKTADAFSIIKL